MMDFFEVRSPQGALLTVPLKNPAGGYVVQNIDGLDPVNATIVSSTFARLDGELFQASRRVPRNLKLRLGLSPDFAEDSVRDLRTRLYQYFMPKASVSLRFHMSDGLVVEINGKVESFEGTPFTKDPMVDISIMCLQPDFVDPTVVGFSNVTTSSENWVTLNYKGSIETGVVFYLNPDRPITAFTIYHQPPDGTLRTMEFSLPVGAGNVIVIDSEPGSKNVTVNLNTPVLYALSPQSKWLTLLPGANQIRVYAEGAALPYDIVYTNKYGGL